MGLRSGDKRTVNMLEKEVSELLTLTGQQEEHATSQADYAKASSYKTSQKTSHTSPHKSSHKSSVKTDKSKSSTPSKSSRSSISSLYIKAQAKARAAQAAVALAQQQAALMRQQAELDAKLLILEAERASAAASAAATVYEETEKCDSGEEDQESSVLQGPLTPAQRTREYMQQLPNQAPAPPVLQLPLPTPIESDIVPDESTEIPSPENAHHQFHIQPAADKTQTEDRDAPIPSLLGRGILRVDTVHEQINRPYSVPYTQQLDLETVNLDEVCLRIVYQPSEVSVNNANVLQEGHTESNQVEQGYSGMTQHLGSISTTCKEEAGSTEGTDNLECSVLEQSKEDDKPALSTEKHDYQDKDSNQVTWIGRSIHPDQLFIDSTEVKPAYYDTRSTTAVNLQRSSWLSDLAYLTALNMQDASESSPFNLYKPEADAEIQPEVTTQSTKAFKSQLITDPELFKQFSIWRKIGYLIPVAASFSKISENTGSKQGKHSRAKVIKSESELPLAKELPTDRPSPKPPFRQYLA